MSCNFENVNQKLSTQDVWIPDLGDGTYKNPVSATAGMGRIMKPSVVNLEQDQGVGLAQRLEYSV